MVEFLLNIVLPWVAEEYCNQLAIHGFIIVLLIYGTRINVVLCC